ncbi:MAG: Sau3AI family type II restriction endonuclease [Pleomorphochaeta sp.]
MDKFKDKKSLLKYARLLEGLSIEQTNNSVFEKQIEYNKKYSGKGKFGQFIEENYFFKKNDNLSAPDFAEIGVELKVSPLKLLKNGDIRVKERLVLNIIQYMKILKDKDFFNSHFLYKNKTLLIIFYFHDNQKPIYKLKIDLVDLWEILERDYKQIKLDYEFIIDKIDRGLAHEISEGDTLYLGACTKGSTQAKSMCKQPHASQLARKRAFCFKTSYINKIYKTLVNEKVHRENLDKRLLENTNKTLEEYIYDLFNPYFGKTVQELALMFNFNFKAKAINANISRKIIGFNKTNKNFYEFDAAGIQIKTIRVESSGNIKEHMSFKNIPYKEIIIEDWEDSTFYEELISKFIFVIFRKTHDEKDYYLSDVKLWNMPQKDIDEAQIVWEITKSKVLNGDFNNFPKAKQNRVSHVRPKGRDSYDLMETENYGLQKKYCFWLNRKYIASQIL